MRIRLWVALLAFGTLSAFADGAKWKTLPLGSIKPEGWLKAQLAVGKAGMGGHLDEREDSAEYRLGLVELAYTLDDPELKAKADVWALQALALQDEDGCLFRFRALLHYYAMTGERKYLDAVHRGLLRFAKRAESGRFSDGSSCAAIELMTTVSKLTGDRSLVDWCDRCAAAQDECGDGNTFSKQSLEVGRNRVRDLAVRAIQPAILWEAGGQKGSLLASERHIQDMDRDVGWLVNYGPSSDDGYTSLPAAESGSEYCALVSYLENFLHLARITGKDDYATRAERLVFNAAMGARAKDDSAIVCFSAPNQFGVSTNSSPCCCSAGSVRLWPEYLRQAILKKGDNYRIQLYGPLAMKDGETEIRMYTAYPFDNRIELHVMNLKGNLEFRRPDWADDMQVRYAGGKFFLSFDCKPVVRSWADRAGGENRPKSVEYGPLVFALPVGDGQPTAYAMTTEAIEMPGSIHIVRTSMDAVHMKRSPWESKHFVQLQVPLIRMDTNLLERVSFVPYGATESRITEFPVEPSRVRGR